MSDNWTKVPGRYEIEQVAFDELSGRATRIWVVSEQHPIHVPLEGINLNPVRYDWLVIEQKFRVGSHTEFKMSIDPTISIEERNDNVLDIYRLQGKKLLALMRTNIPAFDDLPRNAKVAILIRITSDQNLASGFIEEVLRKQKLYLPLLAIEEVMCEWKIIKE